MKLSEKLIKLRKENGLSQEEFGEAINVSRQAVSKWETEEASPDTDKVKEIVEKFGVSYEYLLNEEFDTEKEIASKCEVHKRKAGRKVLLVILILYLLMCVYKFVAFTRFYLIANSFSEEKYSMTTSLKMSNAPDSKGAYYDTTRVGNKIIERSYNFVDMEPKDENGNVLPYDMNYTDIDQKICYRLNYDEDKKAYIYTDRKEEMASQGEVDDLFRDENDIKENTLSVIPSGFKEIFLASIDPRYYYVSIRNRQFRTVSFAYDLKTKVELNQDCLVTRIAQKFEFDGLSIWSFNYDYVPGHFNELTDPRETGRYPIVEEE